MTVATKKATSSSSRPITINISEIAAEMNISYPQAVKEFHRIERKYGLTRDDLPKRGTMLRRYYRDYYHIIDADYTEA